MIIRLVNCLTADLSAKDCFAASYKFAPAEAKGKYAKTRKVSDVILVDEDKDGKILGIEILDGTKNIDAFDPNNTKFSIQTP